MYGYDLKQDDAPTAKHPIVVVEGRACDVSVSRVSILVFDVTFVDVDAVVVVEIVVHDLPIFAIRFHVVADVTADLVLHRPGRGCRHSQRSSIGQKIVLRHPVQGRVRQKYLRPSGSYLRRLLQPIPGTAIAHALQEGMFHHGLFQRMLRRSVTDGRGRKDPNVDQATPRSRSGGLGKTASAHHTS